MASGNDNPVMRVQRVHDAVLFRQPPNSQGMPDRTNRMAGQGGAQPGFFTTQTNNTLQQQQMQAMTGLQPAGQMPMFAGLSDPGVSPTGQAAAIAEPSSPHSSSQRLMRMQAIPEDMQAQPIVEEPPLMVVHPLEDDLDSSFTYTPASGPTDMSITQPSSLLPQYTPSSTMQAMPPQFQDQMVAMQNFSYQQSLGASLPQYTINPGAAGPQLVQTAPGYPAGAGLHILAAPAMGGSATALPTFGLAQAVNALQQQQQQQQQLFAHLVVANAAAAANPGMGGMLSAATMQAASGLMSQTAPAVVAPGPPPATAAPVGQALVGAAMSGGTTIGSMLAVDKVKALVQIGGSFVRSLSGASEYLGGETRLITFPATLPAAGAGVHAALMNHMASSVWPIDETSSVKYELPGSRPTTFIDLLNDADVSNMWEAWQEFCAESAAAAATTAMPSALKLRICIEQGGAAGYGAGTAAAAAAAAVRASADASSNSSVAESSAGLPAPITPTQTTPPVPTSQPASILHPAAAPPASFMPPEQGQQQMAVGGQEAEVQPGIRSTPADLATAAAAAAASGGAQPSLADQALTAPAAMSSVVTSTPRVSLTDIESKLEVMKPDDLKVLRFLGAGGYGEVYLCRWNHVEVAVKCLNPGMLGALEAPGCKMSTEAVSELIHEAMMLGSLRHPNIVWVFGIVLPPHLDMVRSAAGRLAPGQHIDAVSVSTDAVSKASFMPGMVRPPALVTEFMPGGSVRSALSRRADFLASPAVRIKLALDTARGMEYLHAKRIVHFDLKAANLLIGWREGRCTTKVADFGLSKQRQRTYVTGVASLRGTLPWTAPEIIKTPKAVTEKVDVYSFGILLWELWTGREPWEGLNYHALLHQITSCPGMRPPLPGSNEWEGDPPPDLAPGWVELMQQCWSEEPDSRPAFALLVRILNAMYQAASKGE